MLHGGVKSVMGAFMGALGGAAAVAVTGAVALPALGVVAIGAVGGYVVGKGVEYLFVPAGPSERSVEPSVFAGRTDDGRMLLPADSCGTLIINRADGIPVAVDGIQADPEYERWLNLPEPTDEPFEPITLDPATKPPAAGQTCAAVVGLNSSVSHMGGGVVRVRVSTIPEVDGCPVDFSGQFVSDRTPPSSDRVSASLTTPGFLELAGPTHGPFTLTGRLTHLSTSVEFDQSFDQPEPAVAGITVTRRSTTIEAASTLSLADRLVRISYEDGSQNLVTSAQDERLGWRRVSGPGRLTDTAFASDEGGSAILEAVYEVGGQAVTDRLAVTIKGPLATTTLPGEEQPEAEVTESTGPDLPSCDEREWALKPEWRQPCPSTDVSVPTTSGVTGSFRATGSFIDAASWLGIDDSHGYTGPEQSITVVGSITHNSVKLAYSAETGEVTGEFDVDYQIRMVYEGEVTGTCVLAIITSGRINPAETFYDTSTGLIEGTADSRIEGSDGSGCTDQLSAMNRYDWTGLVANRIQLTGLDKVLWSATAGGGTVSGGYGSTAPIPFTATFSSGS
jgi:hypothetical protein